MTATLTYTLILAALYFGRRVILFLDQDEEIEQNQIVENGQQTGEV